eukprot:gene30416-35421_t
MRTEEVRNFVASYESTIRLCIAKLSNIAHDLELSEEDIVSELTGIASNAERCWTVAVGDAECRRESLRQQINDLLHESSKLKEQLGDDEFDSELSSMQEEVDCARVQLKQLLERAKTKQSDWSAHRAERMQEYEALQATNASLKYQLGQMTTPGGNSRPDLSRANLEWMRLEQEKLYVEKDRRLQQVVAKLDQLTNACSDLGEDGVALAASVHPSLGVFWQRHKSQNLQATINEVASRPGGRLSLGGGALHMNEDPDVSDNTVHGLDAKLAETAALKVRLC